MKAPSTALLKAFSPVWRVEGFPWTARGCQWQQQQAHFATSESKMARKGKGEKKDMRISESHYV